MKKIIFDCDAGADDAAALLWLLADPEVEVVAITVSGTGLAHGPTGAKNMAYLCHMMGKPNIPIAYGQATPLSGGENRYPEEFRESIARSVGKNIPANYIARFIENDAIALLEKTLKLSEKELTILVTGPLTNVAKLTQRSPGLKRKIGNIVMMGGAIHVPGNIPPVDPTSPNTVAEWNIYADIQAARIVFSAGIPMTLVPLDATNQVHITPEFYEAMKASTAPALQFIFSILKSICHQFGPKKFFEAFYLWDQLAAMVCITPRIAEVEQISVSVSDNGQTVSTEPKEDGNFEYATTIPNPKAVRDEFLAMFQPKEAHLSATEQTLFGGKDADAESKTEETIQRLK